ncbi:MAG: phospho-N-acetylmuramoyl-pentapeptide-transferase [Actinobacteria bacterium]|nr:phospho-N-acetylmuramoyl-pentapeptide-transferase [Actinomycetota bacterium]
MSYALTVGTITFLMTVIWGGPLIQLLRRKRIGKQIRVEGPTSHIVKAGTPTMGGLLIIIPAVLITGVANLVGRYSMLLPLVVVVGCTAVGGVDDLLNLVGGTRQGLSVRVKFVVLGGIGLVVGWVLYYLLGMDTLYFPTLGEFKVGIFFALVAAIAIAGTAHAVNLTDGLDGLAGGTAAVAFACYGIIAYLQHQAYLVTFCFTMVGATLAFLWYNAHPAQVFMGDTGSLTLGATLATVALMTGHVLLLPIIGMVFVVEAVSVMAQVAYFKLTHGRRLFRMTPIHHHFELLGWSETQITQRFWLLSMLSGMVGIALALI